MFTSSTATLDYWINNSGLPRLEARMLLTHFADISHSYLIAHGDSILAETTLKILNQAAERRRAGEPLAYIIGQREFYGRSFIVSNAVLIPRPETEHLIDAALNRLPKHGCVWDLGTGSGIIAITLACERPDASIWAADISQSALEIAQHNARLLGAQVQFGQGSWFKATPQPIKGNIDLIVSNPPYIDQYDCHLKQGDLRFEPIQALTDFADGLQAIREIIQTAPQWLKNHGWLILEHGYNQGFSVRNLLQHHGFIKIETLVDLAGLERISLGQWITSI